MKIGMMTWGSDGDIRPMCALAAGLADAGHKVTLAITSIDGKNYSEYAKTLGFKIIHIDSGLPNPGSEEFKSISRILEKTVNTPIQEWYMLNKAFIPIIDEMFRISQELAAESDLLINYFLCSTLSVAAEIENKKWITVYPAPCYIHSSYIPPGTFPDLGRFLNPIVWVVSEYLTDILLLKSINKIRMERSLKKTRNVIRNGWLSPHFNIIASSPAFCDRPRDWSDKIQFSGFFNLPDKTEKWKKPSDLVKFLSSGEPPVYMTFGSLNSINFDKNIKLLSDAITMTGKRAIIQSSLKQASYLPDSKNIYMIDTVPHHKIFPDCSAVVHHGGQGTVQSSLFCGLPAVIVAHGFDQVYFARSLQKKGAGYKPLTKKYATPSKIAAGINAITQNPSYKKSAEQIGHEMRAENGVKKAVAMIERFFT
ncbi:MAG: glycosyltransferase [Spirochaetia bacterium]|nr:glycosyltransferase [Spirochaetia bacterium]